MKPPEIIETTRLVLRKPRMEDAEAIFTGYARDPEVTRYLSWRTHRKIDDTFAFLTVCRRDWERGSNFVWAITGRGNSRCIGMIGIRDAGFKAELGYVLARPWWGKGIMTEAAGAIVDAVWQQPDVHRIWAVCDRDNRASARVMEKTGMKREGILRRWSRHPNISPEPRDCFCYSKIK